MIIKHPKKENIPALTHLWADSFGDPESFIAKFFRTGYAPERSLLAEENGQLLAALYWFDCLWEGKKVAYLYAIATDSAFRGKGICTALMQHAHQHLQTCGYAGALLVPADEALERFYSKMGYRQLPLSQVPQLQTPTASEKITPAEYLHLREQFLPKGGVQHTAAAMEYLSTFACFYRNDAGISCGDPTYPLEYLPGYPGDPAMYLPLNGDPELPAYFALCLS